MGVTRFVRSQGWLWPALLALALAVPLAFAGCGGGEGNGTPTTPAPAPTPAPSRSQQLCAKAIDECHRFSVSTRECTESVEKFLETLTPTKVKEWNIVADECLKWGCDTFTDCVCAYIWSCG